MVDVRGDLTGEILDRRFRVESRLGSGGMGTVWRVQHVESLQRLALKTLEPSHAKDPEATARFLREARAASALRSRHVTRVVDAQMGYLHAGAPLPFVVFELLEGRTLQAALDARGRLAPAELVWVARQLARALGEAHQRGIVHRDLKPSNVFVARDEEGQPIVKLCDFGIAKLLGDALALGSPESLATRTGALMGTPMYLAPELLHGAAGAEPATDQWALGLIAFRALAGWDYFTRARTVAELVLAIARDPLAPPSALDATLPAGFDAWFLRSCGREPGARFADVGAQVAALEEALGRPEAIALSPDPDAPAPAGASSDPAAATRVERRPRRAPSALRIAAVAGACVWAVLALAWMQRRMGAPATRAEATSAGGPAVPATSATPGAAGAQPVPAAAAVPAAPPGDTATVGRAPEPPVDEAPRRRRVSSGGPGRAPGAVTAPAAVRDRAPLARGEPCRRSSECASGLCAAETCQ